MKKINIYPFISSLHKGDVVNEETKKMIEAINDGICDVNINISSLEELYNADLSLLLVQSGGSEGLFLEKYEKLKAPYYLLTYGSNNSLAASLEILSFLKDNNKDAEVLHGSYEYLINRIKELLDVKPKKIVKRFGVVGKPSDWLIASLVNYNNAKNMGVELVDIPIDEVIMGYNSKIRYLDYSDSGFDKDELNKAYRLKCVIENIIKEHNLDGFTIRCFALLDTIHTTSCLALAMLNNDYACSCEGDIPSLLSMSILRDICGLSGFQANPSRIDTNEKTIVFAHCTLPFNMCESYKYDTHYESKIGVGIKGELKKTEITIFKLSNDLKNYYCDTGIILENLCEENLCRTQIKVKMDNDISYFLKRPYGNHHIIVYGNIKKEIDEYMKNLYK